MFEPNASWSLPAHLFMVSEWSATCTRAAATRMSCVKRPSRPPDLPARPPTPGSRPELRLDRPHLPAAQAPGELGLLRVEGTEPDCDDDAR